jgi:hypothetical protein
MSEASPQHQAFKNKRYEQQGNARCSEYEIEIGYADKRRGQLVGSPLV